MLCCSQLGKVPDLPLHWAAGGLVLSQRIENEKIVYNFDLLFGCLALRDGQCGAEVLRHSRGWQNCQRGFTRFCTGKSCRARVDSAVNGVRHSVAV